MKRQNIQFNKMKLLGVLGVSCLGYLAFISPRESVEAAKSVATHIGTFEGSTTFTTSSSNGINPGLFIEVMDDKGDLTQYESEEGIITIPNTKEGAYVTQAKLLGKTKYVDEETGEILDQFEEGRNLRLESVENPVLTTTSKNLFNVNGNINEKYDGLIASNTPNFVDGDAIIPSSVSDWHHGKGQKIKIKKGGTYTCSFTTSGGGIVDIYGSNLQAYAVNKTSTFTFTASADCDEVLVTFSTMGNARGGKIYNFQIEYGKSSSAYEPYKTNILTVNEPVELRGIGEVQDTLDLMTGEMTERISEIVLDGSENWVPFNMYDVDGYSTFVATIPTLNNLHNNDVISIINDKFASTSWRGYLVNRESETVWSHDPNKIGIRVKSEKASNVEEIKEFLSTNNIRINYTIATESIKTVDLTSTYFFKPINKDFVQVTGTVTPLVGSVTVPTNPILFTLDPNQEVGQQFIAPEFSISNDTMAPIRLTLNSFEQTTNVLTDVLPMAYENWEGLNKQESKDIALALVPKVSDRWLSLNEGPRYVAETSNTELGVIKAKSSVDFTFSACHGQAFEEVLNPSYRLGFVFEFTN